MIDTITLRLNEWQFKIHDFSKFSPDCTHFFYPPYAKFGSRGYIEAYQNPSKTDLLAGKYRPQLTLRKRWQNNQPLIYLYIQFSAPKLLYHNNFDELVNDDLEAILLELSQRLYSMSVIASVDSLRQALVTKIHYGKNIVLPSFVIPHMVISEIRKTDFDLRHDLAEKNYINSGESIRFHTNEFELIFYDKKKDLQKAKQSEKRAIEDNNAIQLGLFDEFKPKKPFEVLRIELRLNTSAKIASTLDLSKNRLHLHELFKQEISSKILGNYWNGIMDSYKLLSCKINDKEQFLASFMANNPDARLTNALAAYAFVEYIKEMGVQKFRKLIEAKYSKRTWYTLKANIQSLNLQSEVPSYFSAITKELTEYRPLRLANYQSEL